MRIKKVIYERRERVVGGSGINLKKISYEMNEWRKKENDKEKSEKL